MAINSGIGGTTRRLRLPGRDDRRPDAALRITMDLRDLKYFVALAQAGNTRRAAQAVHRSQPALIKAITRLEASLGAEYLLPTISRRLLQEAPDVQLKLLIRMNYESRTELRDGNLDLVLGFVPDEDDTEFVYDTLLEDIVVVAAGAGHPILKTRGTVTLERMARYRWALPNISVASRVWLDQVFQSHGLALPLTQIETNSIPLIPRVIADTDLLSFVSRRTIQASHGRLREIPLAATTLVRNFGLTYPKDVGLSPAAEKLVGLLREHGQALFHKMD